MTVALDLPDLLAEAINQAVEAQQDREERTYLGASVIGDPCERKLWYGFRWAWPPEEFDGRMLRLFRTGHRIEEEVIEDLRRAGVAVIDRDPDDPEKQVGARDLGGHFRCHLDGEATGVPRGGQKVHVLEVKSANAKSFAEMKKHGVTVAKPMHVAQMQSGMALRGHSRALYVMRCKDDERDHTERVKADPEAWPRIRARAERVINAHDAPARISEDKGSFACRFCHLASECHDGAWARRNCRTCMHSTPVVDEGDEGRWRCEMHGVDLNAEMQRVGCSDHRYLPSLVPGEVADVKGEDVVYALNDGSTWTDGAAA